MARIIVKVKYIKQRDSEQTARYAKYVATRDGVEFCNDTRKHNPATKTQAELMRCILRDYPDSREMYEYEDYLETPTRGNATEFISRALEDNAASAMNQKTYADYIATRPRVEKIGYHGLFSDDDKVISLDEVSSELQSHQGNVWTMIVSLHREDAEALGYNNAAQWRDTIRKHTHELAEALNIPVEDLKWYAAFHNESHHPHIHLFAYTDGPKQGYMNRNGINKIRSALARDIFADELHHVFKEQTGYRDKLKNDWRELVQTILERIKNGTYDNPKLEQKLLELSQRLPNVKGKKVYGYLPKLLRDLVNSIVDLLAKAPDIKELYDLWYEKKCEARRVYTSVMPEQEPLSENKEFKSIKNNVIREALGLYYEQHKTVPSTMVTRLLNGLGKLFLDNDISKKEHKPHAVDRRLVREEDAKRKGENYYLS